MTDRLGDFPLLDEFTAQDRSALEELLVAREVDAGSSLFRATEEAEELFFVTAGSLSIRSEGQAIANLGVGDVLGGLCLFSVGVRVCDAVATEPTRVLGLSRESYSRLRLDQPGLALQLGEAVMRSFSSVVRNILVDARTPNAAVS